MTLLQIPRAYQCALAQWMKMADFATIIQSLNYFLKHLNLNTTLDLIDLCSVGRHVILVPYP